MARWWAKRGTAMIGQTTATMKTSWTSTGRRAANGRKPVWRTAAQVVSAVICVGDKSGWGRQGRLVSAMWTGVSCRHFSLGSLRRPPGQAEEVLEELVMRVGPGGVRHDDEPESQARVEAHHVVEAAAGAEVLDVPRLARAVLCLPEPALSDIDLLAR